MSAKDAADGKFMNFILSCILCFKRCCCSRLEQMSCHKVVFRVRKFSCQIPISGDLTFHSPQTIAHLLSWFTLWKEQESTKLFLCNLTEGSDQGLISCSQVQALYRASIPQSFEDLAGNCDLKICQAQVKVNQRWLENELHKSLAKESLTWCSKRVALEG